MGTTILAWPWRRQPAHGRAAHGLRGAPGGQAGAASAWARAASARRRPRRRSRSAWRRAAEGRGRDDRSRQRAWPRALGLSALSGEPRRIDPALLAEAGIEVRGRAVGDDARRQAHVRRHRRRGCAATRPNARRSSPTRSTASSPRPSPARRSSARSPSCTSCAEEHDFDVIVLDTPPSRNALDFLEAPTRLLGFLEGRALQVFLAPGGLDRAPVRARHGARVLDLRARDRRRHARASCRASFARCRA